MSLSDTQKDAQHRYRAKQKSLGIKRTPNPEKQRAAQKRYDAKQRALGIKSAPATEERKAYLRSYMAAKRLAAKEAGDRLPSDQWAANNPDKQREKTARWRAENPERSNELGRIHQAKRRSTPWGQINNSLWTLVHYGVRHNSTGMGLYNQVLGYSWADLRAHLEAQFLDGMTWENWATVWELDHIKPVSLFHYTSVADPLFLECWALSNLRPLWRDANAKKSAIHVQGEPFAPNIGEP
jgi:hypothetical protein